MKNVTLAHIARNEVLANVVELLINQSVKGFDKYGTLVNIDDYSLIGWIEHAQQEITDQLVYLECLKQKLLKEQATP